jgi:hypothetical protein
LSGLWGGLNDGKHEVYTGKTGHKAWQKKNKVRP